MTENIKRHSERQRRICHRGGEDGKKIKAISCELSATSCELLAISCELKAEAYFPLGVIRNNSKGFAVVVRGALIVIRSKCEGSVSVVRTSARRHSEQQRRIYCRDKEDGKCHPQNGEAG